MNQDDNKLVQQVKEWQFDSFVTLYDRYFQRVYSLLLLQSNGQDSLTRDIVKDVFIVAFEQIQTFNPDKYYSFETWLYKIAYNSMNDVLRNRNKDDSELEKSVFSNFFEKHEELEQIISHIDSLWLEKKMLFVLRFWYNLSYDEISVILWKRSSLCKKEYGKLIKLTTSHFKHWITD